MNGASNRTSFCANGGQGNIAVHSIGVLNQHFNNNKRNTFNDILDGVRNPKLLGELQSYFYPGTRQWILDAVWDWATSEDKNKVFAVVGDAGIGKSVLSAYLIGNGTLRKEKAKNVKRGFWNSLLATFTNEETQKIDILAYHFFDFQSDFKAKECIKSLCKQLLHRFGNEFGNYLDDTLNQQVLNEWPLKSCFEKLVLEPLCQMEKRESRSFIVIDALDECEVGKNFNKDVVKVWQDRMPSWVGLFVTCRPNIINFYETESEAARNGVTMIKTGDCNSESNGSIEHNMNDIKLVLSDLLKDRLTDSEALKNSVKVIAQKSEGLFLYLRFFQEQLPDLNDEALSMPTSLPKGIVSYYVEYFDRLLNALGNDKEKYQRMLSVVLTSREPLPLPLWMQACGITGDLSCNIRTDQEYNEFIRAAKQCRMLMHIPQTLDSSQGVTFVHKSMTDFLTNGCISDSSDLHMDTLALHVVDDHPQIIKLIENVFTNPATEFPTANQYAARNLFYHYCKAKETDNAIAMMFQLDSLLTWLKYSTPIEIRNDITTELIPLLTDQSQIEAVQVVVKLLRLGQHALTAGGLPSKRPGKQLPSQLPSQILGRLSEANVENRVRLRQLREEATKYDPGVPWMKPVCASLHSALPGGLLQTLTGHTSAVHSVSFNHDGSRIVSGSGDSTIRIWDSATGQQIGEPLMGHSDAVLSVLFNHDGTRIVSGSNDSTIRIWDTATRQQVGKSLQGHSSRVNSVTCNHDCSIIVSASSDKTIRVWDTSIGVQLAQQFVGPSNEVYSVSLNSDGTQIVSGSDATIRLWDASTAQHLSDLNVGHTRRVKSVAYNHDGTRIVSGSHDRRIRIWDTFTGQQVGTALVGHYRRVQSVAFNHDGTQIVSGSDDKTIRIWDASTGQQVGESLVGHTDTVRSVSSNHDGTQIVSGSEDQTIRIWDTSTGQQVRESTSVGHYNWVLSLSFSHDGTRIVSSSSDRTIRIWETSTGQQVGEPLIGHAGWVFSVAFNHDGTRIVSGSDDKTIRIWDTSTEQQVGEPLIGHAGWVFSVAFNHDGTRIVSGSDDKTIRIWDTSTRQQVGALLAGESGTVLSVSYTRDGTRIVSGSDDKTIRIWDPVTGQQVAEPFVGHSDAVLSVSFSHDGRQIISGSRDKTIRIWDVSTGQQVELLAETTVEEKLVGFRTLPVCSNTSSTFVFPGRESLGFTFDHGTPTFSSCAFQQRSGGWIICLVDENHRIHILHL